MIDSAENPLCVRNKLEQSNAGAVRGRPIDRETLLPARLDTDRAMRGDGVANAGLWLGGCNDHWIAEHPGRTQQRLEAGSVNAIVIAQQEFHPVMLARS